MGCFGYICKGCGTSIRGSCFTGGEKCILIHVRHGKEVGRVEGHYDEYGRIIEQESLPENEKYRGDHNGINGHSEICKSEFDLPDSYLKLAYLRIYRGEIMDYTLYLREKLNEIHDILNSDELLNNHQGKMEQIKEIAKTNESTAIAMARSLILDYWMDNNKFSKNYNALPKPKADVYSGTVAWHSKCYTKAAKEGNPDLIPSDNDPNQSGGLIRKKFK